MKNNIKKSLTYFIIFLCLFSWIYFGGPLKWITHFVITPITNILFLIYNIIGDFGTAIILFTLLVKLCMYPLTRKQLHQTRLMKKLQPELAEIRKRCNGNKQLESIETMNLYKKYNINPLSSITTLFIQLPILIAIYSAIRVVATPLPADNLATRAYPIVAYEGSITADVIKLQEPYLKDLADDDIPPEEKTTYDFHPYLFKVIPLDSKASNILKGDFSLATIFALLCTILASAVQILVARQQQPEKKGKGFFALMKDAREGKEISDSDLAALSTSQMTFMMPLMLFFIMVNLQAALAFYYFLNNITSLAINKYVLYRAERTMDDLADKAILKELKDIKEAKIIKNKKSGTTITLKKGNNKKRS